MNILYDERVDGILPDVDLALLLHTLQARLPDLEVLHQREELKPYECDGLSAYRTTPLLVVLPIKDLVEGLADNMYFVGGALIVTGSLLFASDRVKKGRKTEKSATLVDVLLVGAAQAIATCPGISRSGTTITAGCFVGFDRKFAVRFSFLLSIPAILGANVLSIKDALATVVWSEVPVYLVGVAVAAAVGYACIRLLKMIADKGKFGFFAYYCWIVGAITLVLTVIQK